MKITKLGHCCFVAEPKEGIWIMTDPGAFSTMQNDVKNIAAVLFTHEHKDHLHIDSLKKVLSNNPQAVVITNTAVGKLLDGAGIKYTKIEDGQKYDLRGVNITGFGNLHAEIYDDFGRVQNTGYMIDTLYHPGDAFHYPNTEVDILALPVCGPWMKSKDAIIFANKINPRIVFPIHDGMLQDFFPVMWKVPEHFLTEAKIGFKKLEIGKEENL